MKFMRRRATALFLSIALICSLVPVNPVQAAVLRAPAYVNIETIDYTTFRIRWDNTVPEANGYTLQRSVDGGNFMTVLQADITYNNYTDTVVNGKMYQYRVFARSNTQNGPIAYSLQIPMLHPVSLQAVSTDSDKVLVTWTLPFNDLYPLTGFKTVLERRLSDGTWISVATIENGLLAYLDTGLLEGRRYEYRARMDTGIGGTALFYPNGSGTSAYVMLAAPTDFTASLDAAGHAVLTWADPSATNTGTIIERSVDGGAFLQMTIANAGIFTWTDLTLENGKIYAYRIRHNNTTTGGFSPYTPEVRLALLSPTGMRIETTYDRQVDLSWTYPTADPIILGEAVTQIERRTSGESAWTLVHSAENGVLFWRDQTVKPDTIYYYRIRAVYGSGTKSPWQPSVTGLYAKTVTPLDISFTGYALTNTMIRLEWDAASLSGRRVLIERADSAGDYAHLATVSTDGLYLDASLNPADMQHYRFRLITASGAVSDYSPVLTVLQEAVPAPLTLTVSPAGEGLAGLEWTYPYETESGFEIWRKGDGMWEKIGETARNQLNFQDTGVPSTGTVTWRVRALRGSHVYSAFLTSKPLQQSLPQLPDTLLANSSNGMIDLFWGLSLPKGATYTLQRRMGINDDWVALTELPAGANSVRTALSGMAFDLRILALRDGQYSVTAPYHFSGRVPDAPDSLAAPILGSSRVVLTWRDRSDAEDRYKVFRTTGGLQQEIAQLTANTTQYTDTPVPGAVRYEVVAMNASGKSTSAVLSVIVPAAPAFRDMGNTTWALDAVNTLSRLGVITGSSPGQFNPGASVTRAEYLKMLMASLGILPQTARAPFLVDAQEERWYSDWVHTAVLLGIVIPDSGGRFRPETAATRADMVQMSAAAAAIAGKGLTAHSTDVLATYADAGSIPDAALGAFSMLVGEQIIFGSNDLLRPRSGASRAEAAVILNRLRLK